MTSSTAPALIARDGQQRQRAGPAGRPPGPAPGARSAATTRAPAAAAQAHCATLKHAFCQATCWASMTQRLGHDDRGHQARPRQRQQRRGERRVEQVDPVGLAAGAEVQAEEPGEHQQQEQGCRRRAGRRRERRAAGRRAPPAGRRRRPGRRRASGSQGRAGTASAGDAVRAGQRRRRLGGARPGRGPRPVTPRRRRTPSRDRCGRTSARPRRRTRTSRPSWSRPSSSRPSSSRPSSSPPSSSRPSSSRSRPSRSTTRCSSRAGRARRCTRCVGVHDDVVQPSGSHSSSCAVCRPVSTVPSRSSTRSDSEPRLVARLPRPRARARPWLARPAAGVSAVLPASTRPAPTTEGSSEATGPGVGDERVLQLVGVSAGVACSASAAAPETSAVAMEVPLPARYGLVRSRGG